MGNTVFISFISKTYFTAANIPFGIKYGHVTMNNLRFKKNMYLFALLFWDTFNCSNAPAVREQIMSSYVLTRKF